MSIAILSDIHGNLEAMNTVMKFIKENGINEIYCLGDIVGYGPNPNECIEIVQKNCSRVVIGNHDHAALGLTSTEYFNDFAKISTYWTSNNLSAENKHFLLSLGFVHNDQHFCLVHSSPSEPAMWQYVLSEEDARIEFNHFEQSICFIGHSHFPIVFHQKGYSREQIIKFERKNKYIVNVGSVGQPRDGNPQTCFCIYYPDKKQIEYVRLDYDVAKTGEKIIKAGLPVFLAERLTKGF